MQSDKIDNDRRKIVFHCNKPKSVVVNALTNEGLDGDPPIPCLKLRGMWMRKAGFATGARIKMDTFPGVVVLYLADREIPESVRATLSKGQLS